MSAKIRLWAKQNPLDFEKVSAAALVIHCNGRLSGKNGPVTSTAVMNKVLLALGFEPAHLGEHANPPTLAQHAQCILDLLGYIPTKQEVMAVPYNESAVPKECVINGGAFISRTGPITYAVADDFGVQEVSNAVFIDQHTLNSQVPSGGEPPEDQEYRLAADLGIAHDGLDRLLLVMRSGRCRACDFRWCAGVVECLDPLHLTRMLILNCPQWRKDPPLRMINAIGAKTDCLCHHCANEIDGTFRFAANMVAQVNPNPNTSSRLDHLATIELDDDDVHEDHDSLPVTDLQLGRVYAEAARVVPFVRGVHDFNRESLAVHAMLQILHADFRDLDIDVAFDRPIRPYQYRPDLLLRLRTCPHHVQSCSCWRRVVIIEVDEHYHRRYPIDKQQTHKDRLLGPATGDGERNR